MARKTDEQKRLAKLAAEMGGEQIFDQLEAEYEKVGEVAFDELWEERPMDYVAAVVFLASQDPRWASCERHCWSMFANSACDGCPIDEPDDAMVQFAK